MSMNAIRLVEAEFRNVRGAVYQVMHELAFAASENGLSDPGVEKLAYRCNVSDRTVKRAIKAGLESGLIEHAEGGVGRGNVTVFRFLFDADRRAAAAKKGDTRSRFVKRKKVTTGPVKGDNCDTPPLLLTKENSKTRVRAREAALAEWMKGETEKVVRLDLHLAKAGLTAAEAVEQIPWIAESGLEFGMVNGTILEQFEGLIEYAEANPKWKKKRLKATWRNSCRTWRDKLGGRQSCAVVAPKGGRTRDGKTIFAVKENGKALWGDKAYLPSEIIGQLSHVAAATGESEAAVFDLSAIPAAKRDGYAQKIFDLAGKTGVSVEVANV